MTLYIVADADADLQTALLDEDYVAFTEMDKAVEEAENQRQYASVSIYKTTEIAFYHQKLMNAAAGQPG